MGNKDLPSQPRRLSSDDVEFSQANTDQLTAVWTLNAAAWAHPLSVHDHVTREKILSQEPGAGKSWKTWVLTLKIDPSIIVASVETFERPVLVSTNGSCRIEKGYGIASVFTNPLYRGSSMAKVLLAELKEWLDGDGDGWVSVLYSDIGAEFYHKLGWASTSVKTISLETDPALWNQHSKCGLPEVKLLKEENLPGLCLKDTDARSSELDKRSVANSRPCFAFIPRHEMILWHNKRENLNASFIHGRWETRQRGVISESGRAWLIWHFDEVEHKLKVQRIVILDRDAQERNIRELAAMLRFAQGMGKEFGFMTMEIWNPDKVVIAAAELLASHYVGTQIVIKNRESSIASMRLKSDAPQDSVT